MSLGISLLVLLAAVLHASWNALLRAGTDRLLVSLGAAIFAHELPDTIAMTGVLLVSAGILSLALQGRGIGRNSLLYALGTGCFIGAYSVADGIGVRLSGTSAGYTAWMCLLWGVLAPPVYAVLRDWRSLVRGPLEMGVAASGGVVSPRTRPQRSVRPRPPSAGFLLPCSGKRPSASCARCALGSRLWG